VQQLPKRIVDRFGSPIDLAIISFACLYFEMIVIRWLASDIRMFAYFKNLPLLAAFLGLGLGCARARGRHFWLVPALCLVFAAVVAFAGPLGLVHVHIPRPLDFKFFGDGSFAELEQPAALLLVKFLVVVLGMFFLIVELFATLGERLGRLFDTMAPTRAYTVNLLASLAGIWVFALVSWLGWPPAGWFALGALVLLRFVVAVPSPRRRLVALSLLAATIAVVALAPAATRWSPYQRIDLEPVLVSDRAGQEDQAGYMLSVNHDAFQFGLDLSPAFVGSHPDDLLETMQFGYDLPYRYAQPRRVLVVGAGLGNDVAAALRHGAEHVDAVEIDPAIIELGRALHPEHPYDSPSVRLVNDDARAFFGRTAKRYDLIVFGLLDSHTLLSSMSSLRLDNYIYTRESLEQARSLLRPGGHVAFSFATNVDGETWLASRFYQMLVGAFGEQPVVLHAPDGFIIRYLIGPGIREQLVGDAEAAKLLVDSAELQAPVVGTTDDWPFIYMRDRGVPLYPYGLVLLLVLVGGGGLVVLALRNSGGGLNTPMFLLGAGFMLVEVKSISQLSLLFGSTWLVNALIISAILVLALAANLFVAWRRPARVAPVYVLLLLALVGDYLLPLGTLGGQDVAVRALLGSVLPVLPLLFAGVVFATLFSRATAPAHAFGSNLLGALVGGLLEYVSMATGFKFLGLLAVVLYGASWLALQYGAEPATALPFRGRKPKPSVSTTDA
jgi:predicted membrane-bound spermidine synthase